ncbi:hypothetical protein CHS0354_004863 [Potamilus streckersoni]|uniref:Poly [ADP-ribose] polymerase n=1 Tax=Potamilus streckersoni TaxID=2493646 RepID=A0AAE0S9M6_9BIVA|nr:hypothetical protein CHS0354_004863 [Potamilus streckersoni]
MEQLQWPEWMRAGVRVVRGPDWQLPTQDPKEGDLGTLIYVPKKVGDNKVSVVWDSGKERMYQSGATGKYELRAFDFAQVGIVHAGIQCTSCSVNPIRGMRWSCTDCNNVELCTKCYMNDKHNTNHGFVRRDTTKSEPVSLSKREDEKPIQALGVFENSKVIRGPHWRYRNQDGGDNKVGDVKAIIPVKDTFGNAFVTVRWQINNHVGEYRLGAEGYVDVVVFDPADGGKYYPEHLPLVGITQLRVGDKVKVNLSLNEFKKIQEDASVWDDGMKQCLNEEGTVIDLVNQTANSYHTSKADVQYRNGNKYLIMRSTLYRVVGFYKGGVVRIESSEDVLKNLQKLHGGLKFDRDILATKGKLGRVLKISQTGDLKVSVDKKQFVYSPVCCHPANDPKDVKSTPMVSDSSEEEEEGKTWKTFAIGMGEAIVNLMKGSDGTITVGEAIVEYAGTGKLELLRALLKKSPQQVNHKVAGGGRTALQLASYQGHDEIVKVLISHNADVNLADNAGNTPLLYAAFGKQPEVAEILVNSKGVNINSQNKSGVVPVYVAVNNADILSLKLLVKKGCDVSIQDKVGGDTPMHHAMSQKENQPRVLEIVLGSPTCKFSVKNKNGYNVLHEACEKNKVKAVEIILSKACQIVDETTPEGLTALHIATNNDFVEIVSLLLEKGKANPDLPDAQKRTPLMLAVSKGLKRIVEVLLQGGANINKQDDDGDTALHVILKHESKENYMGINIVYLLVENGADINLKNKEGKTAYDLMMDPSLKEGVIRVQKYAVSPAVSQNNTPLPSHWASMRVTDIIKVLLDPVDIDAAIRDEFSMVKKHFNETMSHAKIISIRRVQNALLWEHYTLQKKEMENKAGGAGRANEMHLYHGTNPDAVDLICHANFDFRMAGESTGARYGQGAYFASEARYSDAYATPDDKKHKFMFVAKVLVGKYCLGYQEYKKPPYLDDENKKKGTYDTCVNHILHPNVYCVFDKNQYYPEYLVEYEL